MRDLMQSLVLAIAALVVIAFTVNESVLHNAEQIIEITCDNPAGCSGLLEQAIAAAPAGAVIQLGVGTFFERPLIINKGLTIQGMAPEKTLIKRIQTSGQPGSGALFTIENDSEIRVFFKTLTIDDALFVQGKAGVMLDHTIILLAFVAGGMSFSTIRDSLITGPADSSIKLNDSAMLVLSDSKLFRGIVGLEVRGAGIAWFKNCSISRYQFVGVRISDSAQAYFENCKISEIGFSGIFAEGSAGFELSDSEIRDSLMHGIVLSSSAKGRVTRSFITNNVINGIVVGGSAVAEIQKSIIADNGVALLKCSQTDSDPENICNGIVGQGSSQIVIDNSVIRNNADWGVATFLKQCGYMEDDFIGKVIFSGDNKIEGNNKSGNHSTMGNPGNHPFKNLPSGQVCVP